MVQQFPLWLHKFNIAGLSHSLVASPSYLQQAEPLAATTLTFTNPECETHSQGLTNA
jgi:hypothetical protein